MHIFKILLVMAAIVTAQEISLFNGVDLENWQQTPFPAGASAMVQNASIVIPSGDGCSGIRWTGAELPTVNYEIRLEAKRTSGHDFFCGLTFPVNDSFLTLIIGGWGGSVVGLSCLDGLDAANNETGTYKEFTNNRWYTIRLLVTENQIQGWINDKKFVDCMLWERELSLRYEVRETSPLGLTTWHTTGAIRNIYLTPLDEVK